METLSLTKDGHRYSFRYDEGSEAKLLNALVKTVNEQKDFGWSDAIAISNQLGQQLAIN